MSVRKKFIHFAAPHTAPIPLRSLAGLSGKRFILPFYHIVSDEDCPHIKHLYDFKTTKQFESDIDYLAVHYQPIEPDRLQNIREGKYAGKRIMLLSFDDGLREMYEVVAPILIRKGIPAVFFLNTDFIDNRALMFRYKASLQVEYFIENKTYSQSILAARSAEQLETALNGESPPDFDSFLLNHKPYMTTEQIKWLINKGFSIGAHNCSHPYYEDLPLEKQLSQTLDSVDKLEKDFGMKQKLFAFPFTDNGVSKQFFDYIFSDGKVDFSFGGAGIKPDTHQRHFQRVPMEGYRASAEQVIKSEYLYFLFRAMLFKNKVVRK